MGLTEHVCDLWLMFDGRLDRSRQEGRPWVHHHQLGDRVSLSESDPTRDLVVQITEWSPGGW